jgi:signal transduction histidine kinase
VKTPSPSHSAANVDAAEQALSYVEREAGDESLQRSERTIAVGRFMLSIAALVIVLVTPQQPLTGMTTLYAVLSAYIAYSAGLLWFFTARGGVSRRTSMPILAADIAWSTLIVGLGEGGVSSFFLLYFFAVCSAAIGWGLRVTLVVSVASASLYLASVLVVRRHVLGPEFYLHSAHLLRPVYLVLLGYLVGLIGEYELSAKRRLIELMSMQREAEQHHPTAHTLLRLFRRMLRFFDADYALLQLRPADASAVEWEGTRNHSERVPVLHSVAPSSWTTLSAGNLSYRVSHALGNWGRSVESFQPGSMRPRPVAYSEEPGFLARSRLRSLISIPVSSQEGTRGRLLLGRSSANYSREDLAFCRTLAAQAAVVLDNVVLQQKAETLAVAEERARIARDIHDGFVQSLASIDVGIEVCRQIGRKKPERLRGELADLQRAVKQGYRDARHYMDLLRDRTLQGPDVRDAARNLIAEFRERTDIEIELQADLDDMPAGGGTGFEVLQIVREGLTNIVRHADANRALVSIRRDNGDIEIVVRDDGRGFPDAGEGGPGEPWRVLPSAVAPWSIRERVAALGGNLALRSRSGEGSEVRVTLPASG